MDSWQILLPTQASTVFYSSKFYLGKWKQSWGSISVGRLTFHCSWRKDVTFLSGIVNTLLYMVMKATFKKWTHTHTHTPRKIKDRLINRKSFSDTRDINNEKIKFIICMYKNLKNKKVKLFFIKVESNKPGRYSRCRKYLLLEAWYSCVLRGSARAWQIQRWKLPANHWTELEGLW
jgi:hypothetical protein